METFHSLLAMARGEGEAPHEQAVTS